MAPSLLPESEQPQPSARATAASFHYSPDGRWYWDGQQWQPASAPRPVLASDAERDRGLTELNDHYGTGRLTFEEFSQRSETILSARTSAELMAVFHCQAPIRLPILRHQNSPPSGAGITSL